MRRRIDQLQKATIDMACEQIVDASALPR